MIRRAFKAPEPPPDANAIAEGKGQAATQLAGETQIDEITAPTEKNFTPIDQLVSPAQLQALAQEPMTEMNALMSRVDDQPAWKKPEIKRAFAREHGIDTAEERAPVTKARELEGRIRA